MINVLKDLCSSTDDGRRVRGVLGSDCVEELNSLAARTEAVKYAASCGIVGGGVSNQSGTYPVDAEGKSDDDVILGRRPVAKYRNDIEVSSARV